MGLIRERHNAILQQLTRTIVKNKGEIFLEQEIPGDPEKKEKKHVVVTVVNRAEKKVAAVDVTILFMTTFGVHWRQELSTLVM